MSLTKFHLQTARTLAVLLIVLVSTLLPQAGHAQQIQQIVAVVNDEPISRYDMEQRLRMIVSSTGLKANNQTIRRLQPQVLQALINERLQLQEAERNNIRVSDNEIKSSIARLEAQNNIPPGSFPEVLARSGIEIYSLEEQIRAQIAWHKLVARRLGPTVNVGDDEIDAILDRMKSNQGKQENLLGEILLTVDSPADEADVRQTAQRLVEQIRNGAQFPAVAREFSQGATAAAGGDAGWVQPGQLPRPVEAALAGLKVGEVSNPIKTATGYSIVLLRDRRTILGANPLETELTLKQIVLPLATDASSSTVNSHLARANSLRQRLDGCSNVEALGKEINSPMSGTLGRMKVGDLPEQFRKAVADLQVGQSSVPVRSEAGVHIFVVCDRAAPPSNLPSREGIRQSLVEQRLALKAQRYLRDLRRDALVEIR
jgi:peptidyl-prolyl cis-trans isomerase SurA